MKIKKVFCFWFSICLFFFSTTSFSTIYSNQNLKSDIIGEIQMTKAYENDNFDSIGRRFNVGYYELIETNPHFDPDKLDKGDPILIPSQFILPPGKREGIIINIAELRLYYFPTENHTKILTEPIGIGRRGWETPVSFSAVIGKEEQPTWTVPESIRIYSAEKGLELPEKVLPGPDNPLGNYALRLSIPSYLIHGTNDAAGVGRRSSAGCIRMFPEGIEQLFKMVTIGTRVTIMNEPIKLGWHNNDVYIEVHKPLYEDGINPLEDKNMIREKINYFSRAHPFMINWISVFQAVKNQQGIPIKIGHR